MTAVEETIRQHQEKVHRILIRRFSVLGEECLTIARDRSPDLSWIDRTGNLRSSIGYVIVYNGQIVKQAGFKQIKSGADGPKEGEDLAHEIAKQYTTGYALIVVAGMEYAAYVEAMDNKDVLTSAELYAKHRAPMIMKNMATLAA